MRLGGVGRNWSWWLGLLSTEDLTCGAVTVTEIIMVLSLPAHDFLVCGGEGIIPVLPSISFVLCPPKE